MVDLKDLMYISAVAELQGIQRAADKVGLSQPALTRRLQNVEERLGIALFDRLSKGMRLTEAGELFLAESQKLLAHAQDFESTMLLHREGNIGHVAFGVKPGMSDAFFRRSVVEFAKLYPETTLSVTIDATPALTAKLKNGEIDFAMSALGYTDNRGSELIGSDELEFEPLFRIPFEVVVRKNHPVLEQSSDPLALFQYSLVCPTPPFEQFSNIQASYRKAGIIIDRPHVQVDDYGMIFDIIENTDMWSGTFASSHRMLELEGKFDFLGQSELLPPLTIGLMSRKSWAVTPASQKLIQIMKKHAEEWLI
ncbi:MAG: LysR family transcriptional regulator [Halioglobus sp.]